MGQGSPASCEQGTLQAGWRVPWAFLWLCEPLRPLTPSQFGLLSRQTLRAPGEEKLALKEVKETLRHLSASNRPLQNSLLMS